jgi:hypothetical protein
MLTPTDEDMDKIKDMALNAGILEKRIAMSDLLDRSFIPSDIKPAEIDSNSQKSATDEPAAISTHHRPPQLPA